MLVVAGAGSNGRGQLGAGHRCDAEDAPTISFVVVGDSPEICDISEFEEVAAGAAHSLLLLRGGVVLACGANDRAQIGDFDVEDDVLVLKPTQIPRTPGDLVVHVACGWESSFAVLRSGAVMVAGCNAHGQAGLGPAGAAKFAFTNLSERCPDLPPIKRIACGLRHTLFFAHDGSVWGCGSNRYGELANLPLQQHDGQPASRLRNHTNIPVPTRITNLPSTITAIACGQHHSVVLDGASGKVLTFGRNRHGQLGRGAPPSAIPFSRDPVPVVGIPANEIGISVFAGWSFTGVQCASGRVFIWGRNDHGQLGMTPSDAAAAATHLANTHPQPESTAATSTTNLDFCPTSPCSLCWHPIELTALFGATQIACGSEHTIAMLPARDPNQSTDADGASRIVAFGWNEHGNCCVGHTQDVLVPSPATGLESVGSLLTHKFRIGAGGGHSLVAIFNTD